MALVLTDFSPNTNDLTNVNSVAELVTTTQLGASTSVADIELGSTQYFTAPNHASLQITSTITLEVLTKPESLTGNHTLIAKGRANGDASDNYTVRINSDGKISFYYASSGPTFHTWTTTSSQCTAGTEVHIAFSYTFGTGSSILCYVNGSSVGGSWTAGTGNSAVATNTEVLQLGTIHSVSGADELYDGWIVDVRIWNVIRTGTEITNNKYIRLTGSETGLAAYYPFSTLSVAWTATPSDTITLSDATVKTIGKYPSDTATLTEVKSAIVTHPVTDSITLSDSAINSPTVKPSDSIVLSDTSTKTIGTNISDSVTLSDALISTIGKLFTDTITLTDIATTAYGHNRTFSETVYLSDRDWEKLVKGTTMIEITPNSATFTQYSSNSSTWNEKIADIE